MRPALKDLTISTASAALERGDFSARELTDAYLEAIAAANPNLNAYLEVFASSAKEKAGEVDQKRARGDQLGALAGIPLAIKDNILIKGHIASAASKMLADYRASYDATVIEKIKYADAVILGRTNMDEFAMGSSTENSAFGPTKNPHDSSRVAGGTSGGSAAAVGADLALAALGSDTGGSIRQPASFCGVVGLKPTYGAVSRYGLIADASSLDQIGPLAKTVADAEILFGVMKGQDPADSTSLNYSAPARTLKKTIGIPRHFLQTGLDPAVEKNFAEAVARFTDLGYAIVDVDLSALQYSLACYYIIQPAEAATNLARFDGLRYGLHLSGDTLLDDYVKTRGSGFGLEVRRRIMLGTYVLSAGYYDAYYAKATQVRRLIREAYERVFATVDAVLTPTAPTPAFPLGSKTADPLQMYLEDIFTVPANLAGIPALSLPSGVTAEGLPLGIQLAAPAGGEDILFALGKDFTTIA